jgi:hypothetical protein
MFSGFRDPEFPFRSPRLNNPIFPNAVGFIDPRSFSWDDEEEGRRK